MDEIIENLQERIAFLEEKLREQEWDLRTGTSEIATKEWVDAELSRRLRLLRECRE